MKIGVEEEEDVEFQMAPMIDMVFLLLVFFMCASHLSQSKNIPLDMPEAAKGVVPKDRPDRWTVNITTDGTIYTGMDETTIDLLKAEVTAKLKETPDLKVYLRADGAAPHKEVKKVMRAMAEVGIDDFIFGVYTPQGGAGP